ncbi:alpha/beta hydrolase [Danxiaibacter flavus]|uniref:Alpha/beta hydrolase n=1 Tax=Danxiaibacter flavus TaxID=3049108 RepID=A0ABV3ZM32_9BACT|nr:alpha/beta hydrolase [Chitinophagaceae bacterium DXS]
MCRSINSVRLVITAYAVMLLFIFSNALFAQNSQLQTGYANVNGLKMYYEMQGSGTPLILLHGAFMNTGTAFGQLMPELSKKYKVIAVDLQGHGRTADIDRPFSFESLADDVASLLKFLKIDSANIMGYSLGGGVALQVAIRHPEIVRKLVIVSAVYKFDGWYPETRTIFPTISAEAFSKTPLKTLYDSIAPDPKHFEQFVSKMRDFVSKSYDFGADKVKAIKSPACIILGDSDGVQPEHAAEMFRLLGGGQMGDLRGLPNSRLAIFPATTHVGIMMHTDWLLAVVPDFLDAPIH